MFYTTSGSSINYSSWDPYNSWDGIPKAGTNIVEASSSNETNEVISAIDQESFFYGVELRSQGKYREAKDFFVTYIKKNPDDQAAYVELYNCYSEETADDLIKYFSKFPKNANRDNEFLLSYLYLRVGNSEMAKKINKDIIAKYPNSSQSIRAKLDNVSIALYNEDNLNEAVSLFEDAAVKQNLSTPFELSLAQENILSYAKSRGVETLFYKIPLLLKKNLLVKFLKNIHY